MIIDRAGADSKLPSEELRALREVRGFVVAMGIALALVGAAAMACSVTASLATVLVFGLLLLAGSLVQVVTAFWTRRWHGFFLHLLGGGLFLIAGLFMIQNPFEAMMSLTFLIAVCLLTGGAFRVVLSLLERFSGWQLMLLNGAASLLLGAAIWAQWPLSGPWVIGFFVGIDMVLSGVSWMMLGLAARADPSFS